MALTVAHNTNATFATRQQTLHTRSLGVSFERLSSGLRINGAKDDAAGLSITARMEAQIRSLNRRVQNANDALSFAQTAESILGESTNHLQRMRELALQAANTTYAENDRIAIQQEINQLKDEITNNGSLEFNHKHLFDETHSFFISEESGQSLGVRLGAARSQDLGKLVRVTSTNTVDANRALADGEFSIIANGESTTIRGSNENDDILSTTQQANSAIAKAAAINAASAITGVSALVEQTQTFSENVAAITLNEQVYLKINNEVISGITVTQNDTDGSLKDAINAVASDSGVIATQSADGRLVLTAQDGRNIEIEVFGANTIAGFTDAVIGGKITLQSKELFEVDMQGKANIALGNIAKDPFNNGSNTASLISDGKVTGGTAYSTTNPSSFLSGGGQIDLSGTIVNARDYVFFIDSGTNFVLADLSAPGTPLNVQPFPGTGVYKFTEGGNIINLVLSNTASLDSDDSIVTGNNDSDAFAVSVAVGPISFGGGGAIMGNKPVSVQTIDVTTQDAAIDSLFVIDFAIEQLSESRAQLGAVQNRLSSTINNLQVAAETTSVAASRIRDADFATETAEISRVQIVQQASISLLAQANQAPQVVLTLLGGI